MYSTLALLALTLTVPKDANELTLSDVRPTYGILGPKRAVKDLLPGDNVFLAFDIEGITIDDSGKVKYSIATEVTDAGGKPFFKQPPRELEAITALGGNRVPAYAQIDIGLQQPAGEYTLKLTVADLAAKTSKTMSHSFKVAEKDFGIVRLTTSGDPEGINPVGLPLGEGQSLWLNFATVGFARNGAKAQPNVAFEVRVLDDKGKPTLAKPFAGVIDRDVDAKAAALPVQFHLGLNRPGSFTVEITAKDANGGKTAKTSFPITVSPAK